MARGTCEGCHSLDVRQLHRKDLLRPGLIAPRRTRPSHPQHPFHKKTIVVSVASRITDLPWQFRCDPFPLGTSPRAVPG